MNQSFQTLEFNQIIDKLKENAYTEGAKERIEELNPYLSETEVIRELRNTTEARKILDTIGTPPIVSLADVHKNLMTAEQGGCLTAEQLEYMGTVLTAVSRLKVFLCRCKVLELSLPFYELELDALDELREELHQKIRNGKVDDFASRLLKDLRTGIEKLDSKMHMKADVILKKHKDCFTDSFITMRNNRICLPVKKECKFKISGSVIDKSSTGATLFIEPAEVARMSEELQLLKIDEENEERRILYVLSGMLAEQMDIFLQNERIIEKLDFIFAKGKLSADYDGKQPVINTNRYIRIRDGRHPLLPQETCVPLNFSIGEDYQGVIITGPNTGGKTVALKTVGLHCLMAQCGLHIPCDEADICMNSQILSDIGDGQNMTENLSTFSAHIKMVLDILKKTNRESLILMDELGSGTDPMEGMGIATAILEEMKQSGCLFLVTTHYPEIKTYAKNTQGVVNARMAFDRESLKPLYQLEIGEAGESCAFYIAKRLGMPGNMLRRASKAAYGTEEIDLLDCEEDALVYGKGPAIIKKQNPLKSNPVQAAFQVGDSVMVYPDEKIGIVYQPCDDKGELLVQMPDQKIRINQKRVKLQVSAQELYPEDYDFSIIFDTVENRKARHKMGKRHRPDLEIREKE